MSTAASLGAIDLSAVERAQLGTTRLRQDGTPSAHPYPDASQWDEVRAYLVERSRKANPALDDELTAYTPGETLALLAHPEIKAWHASVLAELPAQYEKIVLVPCAKTKPWEGPAANKSKLYTAYNALRAEHADVCFVTVSEPLGVVPMSHWSDFPQYDNPGLFKDDAQQSGMTKKEWVASPFGRWYGLPFDKEAWADCIARLGTVVGDFLALQGERQVLTVVDNGAGPQSTHGAMLDVALERGGLAVERYPKRIEARVSPLSYLQDVLADRALESRMAVLRPRLSSLESAPKSSLAPRPSLAAVELS